MKNLPNPRPVFVGSPYRGDRTLNLAYANECRKHSISLDEVPFLPHLILTDCLDDNDPVQREQGIQAGLAVADMFKYMVFYDDLGFSDGMLKEYSHGLQMGYKLEKRKLPGWGEPMRISKNLEMLFTNVCRALRVPEKLVKSRSRIREYFDARIIYCYIAKNRYKVSDNTIGQVINRDHVTVGNSHKDYIHISQVWAKYIEVSKLGI